MTRCVRLPLLLLLASGLVGALTGCQRAPATAAPPAPAIAAATSPTATAAPTAGTGACVPLKDWQIESGRRFVFSDNQSAVANDASGATPYTVHFKITQDGNTVTSDLVLADSDPSAIVVGDEDIPQATQVCDGHIFVVNLASERGGTLALGNLRDGTLAMTRLNYESGDEDTAEVSFKDGFVIVTDSNGSVRLQETADPDPNIPAHGLVAEYVDCERDDPEGHSWLRLNLDVEGGVRALEYLSVMPDGNSCTVTANTLDGETTFTRRGDDTELLWSDGDDEAHSSRMRIEHRGDTYRLVTTGHVPSSFCGHSAQLAESVSLQRGQAQCTAVQWPAN